MTSDSIRAYDLPERVAAYDADMQIRARPESLDVIFSSYALHHLDAAEKLQVVRQCLGFLKPGGWMVNADVVAAESTTLEERIQELRVEGVVRRAPPGDARFQDKVSTRAFLDDLEAKEKDQPLSVLEDLRIFKEAGLSNIEIFWKEHREAVLGGTK